MTLAFYGNSKSQTFLLLYWKQNYFHDAFSQYTIIKTNKRDTLFHYKNLTVDLKLGFVAFDHLTLQLNDYAYLMQMSNNWGSELLAISD